MKLNKLNTYEIIRICLLIVILAALVYVYERADDDPCSRCSLQIEQLNKTMTCRELITDEIFPRYNHSSFSVDASAFRNYNHSLFDNINISN